MLNHVWKIKVEQTSMYKLLRWLNPRRVQAMVEIHDMGSGCNLLI